MTSRRTTAARPVLLGCALALAATALCTTALAAGVATARTAAGQSWKLKLAIQYLPPATNRSQYQAVLTMPGTTWLLGGTDVGGHGRPKIEQVRSGLPRSVPLPRGPHSWITAVSATSRSDIWAVTYLGGSVLRWNGSAWSVQPRGGWKPGTRFTGITAVSPSDVWLFGTTNFRYIGAGTWHLTGTKWTRAKGTASRIYQASEAAPADLWAIGVVNGAGLPIGANNALLHFTGSSWRHARPAALAGFRYTHVLALGRASVWVAGTQGGHPELGHFDGSHWTAFAMPGTIAATGMCRDGLGGLWVAANTGKSPSVMRERSAAGHWTRSVVSSNPANEVLACGLVPNTTRVWGAGKSSAPHGSAAAGYRYGT